MSMNLHASCDNKSLDLWQTPTYITYMCCVNDKGQVISELKGKRAIGALRSYIEWVKGSAGGVFQTLEYAENKRTTVYEHVEYIENAINSGYIKVWIM